MSDDSSREYHPLLSESAFREAKAMTGVALDTTDDGLRRRHCWNKEATEDSFRHFAHGYGDENPLFTDSEYAAETRWNHVIAPPTWLYTVDRTVVAPKLPGVQWIHGGNRFEFERPVQPGDRFHVEVKQVSCERKRRSDGTDMVIQTGQTRYLDQHDELVATALCHTLRIPRDSGAGNGETTGQDVNATENEEDITSWTTDELDDLESEILSQSRRGDDIRYWDTVCEGDELEQRIKGPLSLTDILCWYAGYGTPLYNANEMFVRERQRHPGEAVQREDLGIYEHAAMGHLDPTIAAGVGIPKAYDVGPQRITWLLQTVTDWMSDAGFVTMFDAEVRGMNYIGDVTYCRGTVSEKRVEESSTRHVVDIDLEGANQDGEVTITAECTVELPSSEEDLARSDTNHPTS